MSIPEAGDSCSSPRAGSQEMVVGEMRDVVPVAIAKGLGTSEVTANPVSAVEVNRTLVYVPDGSSTSKLPFSSAVVVHADSQAPPPESTRNADTCKDAPCSLVCRRSPAVEICSRPPIPKIAGDPTATDSIASA